MSPSPKMMELLAKMRGTTKGREFSRPRNLKIVFSTQNLSNKKFLAVSPVFMRKYGKDVSVAAHLIAANLKRLKSGEVIEEKGFVIKKASTGKAHQGNNTELTLSVSFKGKTFFVKRGTDSGEGHLLAYQKVKELFKSINNQFNGYKVEVVPYHLLYLKSNMRNAKKSKGFLVSDFFPSEKVSLVKDIEKLVGSEEAFDKTRLGQSLAVIKHSLYKKGFSDFGNHNCFFDEVKKTIYFFDLWIAH